LHPTKQIWDVDYLSTSDEEDNDSDDQGCGQLEEDQVDSDGEQVGEQPKRKVSRGSDNNK
jgi:hypothetical protein